MILSFFLRVANKKIKYFNVYLQNNSIMFRHKSYNNI